MPVRDLKRAKQERLRRLLRERVIAGIHSGHHGVGDRLPTYRAVAEETGADLRAVARVYRDLEREGLVEIRGRSGVFVAPQERIGGKVLAETSRWAVQVLREARLREIRIPDFPEFVRQCVETVLVRCACIESTEDQLSALCEELERDFGFRSSAVHASSLGVERPGGGPPEPLPTQIRAADFLVTTLYHAAAIRPISERLSVPLVVVRLSGSVVRRLEQRLATGPLTVVHVDPEFVDRLRAVVPEHADRIRSVPAHDRAAVAALDPSEPVLVSPAARRLLDGSQLPPPAIEGSSISSDSAGELIDLLIRFNLEAIGT